MEGGRESKKVTMNFSEIFGSILYGEAGGCWKCGEFMEEVKGGKEVAGIFVLGVKESGELEL